MKRLPIVSTIVVLLAVVTMIALGIWQLQRRDGKEALLASFARNADLPVIAFPDPPVGERYLFRRATAQCASVADITRAAGRSVDGVSGYRYLADCTSETGSAYKVEMGVAADPGFMPVWRGGSVTGQMTYAPNSAPLLQRWFGGAAPDRLMLVATSPPVAGLLPSRAPDPSGVPNNHLAYAVQWFAFAGIALVIYGLALRRRMRGPGAQRS
ncbi:SURF1 family protein [Sphingomonas qomolangmaensis]|uniref:SURF1-like protein n=1 Tax=Sphingomonas qomolangmaensis TaxID=2918765 RepID=A0ABY5L781_9SPHN|nr:SURF1 family protein [Sphingomonas qomolangmaensis]UUL81600.1 SURF1 family protein [Sphingomonas qomolangmaensis]